MTESLQERYAPRSTCFGCGPANKKGLRIRSIPEPDAPGGPRVVCNWTAEEHHQAFPGMLNGGICGALLDCHSNWTAAWTLMRANGLDTPPVTVTAEFHVKLQKPTPLEGPLRIVARAVENTARKVVVEAELIAGGEVTSTCRGVFVAVKEGHPAYHRW